METTAFDYSKIWSSINTKKYVVPSNNDIKDIIRMINTKYGGIFPKKKSFYLRNDFLYCNYMIIIIEEHLCLVVKILGSGVFGKVYKAYDTNLRKMVAIKSQKSKNVEKVNKQAMITKNHGIGLADTTVHAGPSFLDDGNAYFILPLADICYYHWVIRKASMDENKLIIKSLIKIANDLVNLHSSGYVHLDLKYDNVLVLDDVAYLSDFGQVEPKNKVLDTIVENQKDYPHMPHEFFREYNNQAKYLVNEKYDIYSYGYFMRGLVRKIKDSKLSLELHNISSYIYRPEADQRYTLTTIITYLEKLL